MLRGDVPILAALLGVGVVLSPLVMVRADDAAAVAPGGESRSARTVAVPVDDVRAVTALTVDPLVAPPIASAPAAVLARSSPAIAPRVVEGLETTFVAIADRGFALVTGAMGLTRVDGPFALDGRAVLVHVAASWCAPCAEDLPGFFELAALAPRTVFIAAEDVAGPSGLANAFEALLAWAEPSSRAVPTGLELRADPAWAWARWLGHETLPLTAVIDRRGRLVFVAEGALDEQTRERVRGWLEEGS